MSSELIPIIKGKGRYNTIRYFKITKYDENGDPYDEYHKVSKVIKEII